MYIKDNSDKDDSRSKLLQLYKRSSNSGNNLKTKKKRPRVKKNRTKKYIHDDENLPTIIEEDLDEENNRERFCTLDNCFTALSNFNTSANDNCIDQ